MIILRIESEMMVTQMGEQIMKSEEWWIMKKESIHDNDKQA